MKHRLCGDKRWRWVALALLVCLIFITGFTILVRIAIFRSARSC
jgi:hypothetical protein